MISLPASPARQDAERPDRRFGRWLVAFALGLVALGVLAFVPVENGMAASARPAVTFVSAQVPAKAHRLHRLDRAGTAVSAADIEAAADPALPTPPAEMVPVRTVFAARFHETSGPLPAPLPAGSLLRPPRTA